MTSSRLAPRQRNKTVAETATGPNNALVEYRGKATREMPSKSQSQSRAMHAAEEGRSTIGIPKKVGAEFVKADHGRKIKRLPKHAYKMAKRGLVSPKQMAKMKGEE
jgi:hypothetical protein